MDATFDPVVAGTIVDISAPGAGGVDTGYRSVLIGEETLLVECGELLRARGHEIVAVVAAEGSPAAAWARRSRIRVLTRARDLLAKGNAPLDWIFSISNLAILPGEVLSLAARGAINFHDGPLPARGGLNTPVWALLEGERDHGVTWHLMTGAVDEGAVLAAEPITVSDGETAFSLNTRCFEAGLRSFSRMVDDLDGAVVAAAPQPHAPVRMFGRAHRPSAAGTIDWTRSAEEIARLVSALDFGPYANPMGLPKAVLAQGLVLVQQVTVLAGRSGRAPGTLLSGGERPVVATGDRDLRIDRMTALDGSVLSGLDGYAAGAFQSLDASRRARLDLLDAAAGRHEAWWRRRLRQRDSLQLPSFRPLREGEPSRWNRLDATVPTGPAAEALAVVIGWLARLADRDSVEIGFADAVSQARLEDVSNWFAHELPFKVAVDFGAPLALLVERVEQEIAALHRHVGYSADLLARCPELRGKASIEHPIAVRLVDKFDDAVPFGETVLELAICTSDGACRWTYDAARLPETDAEDLLTAFEIFQAAFRAAPETDLGRLSLLSDAERACLLEVWNERPASLADRATWYSAFADQAASTPDRVAVTAGATSLTYGQLEALSNRMARLLTARGVGPETLVGLHLSRSVEMLACLIAVHKAGGGYVPLDPAYPKDRLAHMVADSGMTLIVSETALKDALPHGEAQVLCMEDLRRESVSFSPEVFESGVGGDSLAYMIYTSGSTGLPKGVVVEHRNLLNFFAGMDGHIEPEGTWLAVTSLSFDISALELLWPLMHGYHVVIASERQVRGDVSLAPPTRRTGFSLFYFASSSAGSAAENYQLLLEGARFADEHGFEAVWTPERHFHAFGGPYPNPSVASAAIAAVTSRVGIRAGSVVGTLHHPLRIAEEWAVVDNLSGGRVGLAFASGWQPNDFVLNPSAFADRPGTLKACMEDVRALWRGEARRFPGPLGSDVEVLTYPRPVQGELPCWITSAGNVETFIEAGRVGAYVLTHLLGQSIEEVAEKIAAYRQAWREAGHAGEGHATLMLHTFLGEDEAQVRDAVRGPLIEYLRTSTALLHQHAWAFPAFRRPGGVAADTQVDLGALSEEETEALLEHAFERYFETSGLFGTPEDNLPLVRRLGELGVDEIGCLIDFGIETERVLAHLPAIDRLRGLAQADVSSGTGEPALHALMARHGVTHLQCTPSLLQTLASDPAARPALAGLRRLMVGGEAFPPHLAQDMRGLVRGSVMNMYGPTETTVWSAVHDVTAQDNAPPLGRPLANQQIYILDRRLEPVRPGAPGELVIGGAGVVRGYHRRPELTAERFVAHPFVTGARAYRTGDLARQRADGTLEFLGRLDHQVKIRGYRIELGEIEAALAAHHEVAEAVVVARSEGAATRLIGYVAGTSTAAPFDALRDRLREHLRRQLPEFMVPGSLVLLGALPRTPNGKIDRKALPEPGAVRESEPRRDPVETPASPIEAQIREIWCDLLHVPHVGREENFFDIGGHSLLAIQVHRRLAAAASRPVVLTDIFRFPTIAALGTHLSGEAEDAAATREGQDRAMARRAALARRGAVRTVART
ncbi:MupA/Atu3671 family FMN-dependent luciferase-like monooxygenase [Novosphingobium sp.]|uniref:MupA/Atu3671 family FMN-dependent luciferase-like monooxygenase n=1 Tax=Novosphingobium sp. TaxID=1874826 RepID=UPI003D6C8ACD